MQVPPRPHAPWNLMNVLLPWPIRVSGSSNQALAHAAREQLEADGHRVVFHDLTTNASITVIRRTKAPRRRLPPGRRRPLRDLAAAVGSSSSSIPTGGPAARRPQSWIDRVVRPASPTNSGGDSAKASPAGLLKARPPSSSTRPTPRRSAKRRCSAIRSTPVWRNCVFACGGVEESVAHVRRRVAARVTTPPLARRARRARLRRVRKS